MTDTLLELGASANEPACLRTPGASRYLSIPESTLTKMRVAGTGPAFVRYGNKSVRYRIADLEAWLETRVCKTTADHRPIAA
jgi:hypothetical protein